MARKSSWISVSVSGWLRAGKSTFCLLRCVLPSASPGPMSCAAALPALLLPAPTSLHASAHYAHFVAEVAASAAQMALWLRVRVGTGGGDDEDDEDGDGEDDAWDVWNAVRTMCSQSP